MKNAGEIESSRRGELENVIVRGGKTGDRNLRRRQSGVRYDTIRVGAARLTTERKGTEINRKEDRITERRRRSGGIGQYTDVGKPSRTRAKREKAGERGEQRV